MQNSLKLGIALLLLFFSKLLLGAINLNSGEPVNGFVSKNKWKYYTIPATPGSTSVTVSITGLTADVDLYVNKNSKPNVNKYVCRPYSANTNSETCTLDINSSVTVHIGIRGYSSGSYVLKAVLVNNSSPINTQQLTSEQTISSSVEKDSWNYYKIATHELTTGISISLTNLSSDLDLYVLKGSHPTKSKYDCRPYKSKQYSERCLLDLSSSTDIYIGVYGYTAGKYKLKAALFGYVPEPDVQTLLSGQAKIASVNEGDWKHYKIIADYGPSTLKVNLSQLSADVDLYVKLGEAPARRNYDCRPYKAGIKSEDCTLTFNESGETAYISVRGYRTGNYTLSATLH